MEIFPFFEEDYKMAVKLNLANNIKPKERILHIPVDSIERNPNQPRKIFEEAPLFELAESWLALGDFYIVRAVVTDQHHVVTHVEGVQFGKRTATAYAFHNEHSGGCF